MLLLAAQRLSAGTPRNPVLSNRVKALGRLGYEVSEASAEDRSSTLTI